MVPTDTYCAQPRHEIKSVAAEDVVALRLIERQCSGASHLPASRSVALSGWRERSLSAKQPAQGAISVAVGSRDGGGKLASPVRPSSGFLLMKPTALIASLL
jgi:hypothetical protein